MMISSRPACHRATGKRASQMLRVALTDTGSGKLSRQKVHAYVRISTCPHTKEGLACFKLAVVDERALSATPEANGMGGCRPDRTVVTVGIVHQVNHRDRCFSGVLRSRGESAALAHGSLCWKCKY